MAKIYGWRLGTYQPNPEYPRYVVDCRLYDTITTENVFWSPRCNSYVLVFVHENGLKRNSVEFLEYHYWKDDKGRYFNLCSINGAGEIRWDVAKTRIQNGLASDEDVMAARHFNLV